MSKRRYSYEDRETVVGMFLHGIDQVSFDVLRDAISAMQADSRRLDRLERKLRMEGAITLEVRFSGGYTLRNTLDKIL